MQGQLLGNLESNPNLKLPCRCTSRANPNSVTRSTHQTAVKSNLNPKLPCRGTTQANPKPMVPLQGHMSGKDFARSVVCSVHTNQIEEYLAKVDAMPEQLTTAKVCCPQYCLYLWVLWM